MRDEGPEVCVGDGDELRRVARRGGRRRIWREKGLTEIGKKD